MGLRVAKTFSNARERWESSLLPLKKELDKEEKDSEQDQERE